MKTMTMRRWAALLLTLVIGLCPCMAQASDFTPGDMLPALWKENIAAGREITAQLGLNVDKLAIGGAGAPTLAALLSTAEVEARYYDDFGTACVKLSLRISGEEVASANARVDSDGTVTLTTSLVPGKTIVAPGEWIARMLGAGEGSAMQALRDYLPTAYITYFYRLGGWVSNTQMYREDLYVSVDEQAPATDARDEVSQAMHYRVYNDDFLTLLESVTFYLRDTDPEFKQCIADALAELGVTRGQLRKLVDTLFTREDLNGPDHWVTRTEYLDEEELAAPVTYNDVYYLATHLAYSVKTCQAELIDGVTDFVVSEGTDYDTVGFDGTMPQMWADFPFKNGSLVYNRKTLEGEGVHHTAQGHMDLIDSGYAVDGDLDFYWADKNPDDFTNTFDIGMDFVRESESFGFDANVNDRLLMDGETDRREVSASLSVYADDAVRTLNGELVSATQEIGEGDFTNETSLRVALDDLADASVSVKLSSGEYQEIAMPETVINLETATQEEIDAIRIAFNAGALNVAYTALSTLSQE